MHSAASRQIRPVVLGLIGMGVCVAPAAAAPDSKIVIRHVLVAGPVTRGGRYALHRDPVEQAIGTGKWSAPTPGDPVPGSEVRWIALEADKNGTFSSRAFTGGYAWTSIPSDSDRVMILEAAGHNMVYVNGAPRTGDPYGNGYVRLPVQLLSR